MIQFTAARSPRLVSRAIEEYARGQGHVSALVVPWESDHLRLSMAVSSVTGEGWAIEHTDLGTITLTDLGNDTTRVAIAPREPGRPDQPRLADLFDRFARQLQQTFQVAP
jgi:hypothetical protein